MNKRTLFVIFGVLARLAAAENGADDEGHEDLAPSEHISEDENHYNPEDEQGADSEERLTPEQMRMLFGKIDADRDGKVSKNELKHFSVSMHRLVSTAEIGVNLEAWDANKDGGLSLEESMNVHFEEGEDSGRDIEQMVHKEKFKAADLDGDGFLNSKEILSFYHPMLHHDDSVLRVVTQATMNRKDEDGDGFVTRAELWGTDHSEAAGEEHPPGSHDPIFAKMDLDHDGKLNLQELQAYHPYETGEFMSEEQVEHLFETADQDQDGMVTAAEFDGAHDAVIGHEAHYKLMYWAQNAHHHSEL